MANKSARRWTATLDLRQPSPSHRTANGWCRPARMAQFGYGTKTGKWSPMWLAMAVEARRWHSHPKGSCSHPQERTAYCGFGPRTAKNTANPSRCLASQFNTSLFLQKATNWQSFIEIVFVI